MNERISFVCHEKKKSKQIHLFVFWENLRRAKSAFGFIWSLVPLNSNSYQDLCTESGFLENRSCLFLDFFVICFWYWNVIRAIRVCTLYNFLFNELIVKVWAALNILIFSQKNSDLNWFIVHRWLYISTNVLNSYVILVIELI